MHNSVSQCFNARGPRGPVRVTTLATSVGAILASGAGIAQEGGEPAVIEEIVAVGRFLSAAESLTSERLELPVSADFLSADVISRAADPDIGSALRRVPGITLVDGKFVYVRGLGERYSSVLINGAAVPSPDLTRSVVPLDLFPTSIVESIKIQKSPSADATAAFGGGMIDVRTTSVPQGPVVSFNLGYGLNSISDDSGLFSNAGGTPIPTHLLDAVQTYQGDVSVSRILSDLRASDPLVPISVAQGIHQGLIDSLNSDVAIRRTDLDPDISGQIALGNAWDIGRNDEWTVGIMLTGTHGERWRNETQRREAVGNPAENFLDIDRTVYEERSVTAMQFGLNYLADHAFEVSSYLIRNDEDEANISRGFDQNNELVDLDQKIGYETRLQERELRITQISGSHTFYESFDTIRNQLEHWGWEDLSFDWFYSESEAQTDIPNQTTFQGNSRLDAGSMQPISTQLLPTTTAGQFSFLDLDDDQNSWGSDIELPLHLDRAELTLSGGWWGSEKSRGYSQYNVNLNAVGVPASLLAGDPGDVFGAGNVTVGNGFDLTLGSQFGTESYVAAQTVDAGYGAIDIEWDRWRWMVGARWEDYRQAVLPIDLLDFSGSSIVNLQDDLRDPNQRLAIREDDKFLTTALTFNGAGQLGSDDFQLRISYGETIVRPDLREVADVIYIDPDIDIRVRGNPGLRSSPIDNFEVRGEFFYGNGDNFTVSLFHKDIQSPIEQIRQAGSDDDVVLGFANAQSGEITGIEFEGLKSLPAGLFLTGNVTLSDSEITLDPTQSSILTNPVRRMTGHSEWVVNTSLGYDSDNGRHSAYLNFNAFGERIWFAGTGGNGDAFEQPFHSLGLVYKYFPTEQLQLQLTVDNLLDDERTFEQTNISGDVARILAQDVGRSIGLSLRWTF